MAADTWYIKGEGGAVIPMVPPLPEGITARLRSGALQRVTADGARWVADAPAAAEPAPATLAEKRAAEQLAEQTATGPLARPERDARKGAWVAYAASTGEITEDAANDLTLPQLRERFGG